MFLTTKSISTFQKPLSAKAYATNTESRPRFPVKDRVVVVLSVTGKGLKLFEILDPAGVPHANLL